MRSYDYDRLYTQHPIRPPEPYGWWWGPGSVMPDAPMYGWGWWGGGWGWPPQAPRYGADYMPHRRPPRESPTYGSRADEYARQWAQHHGYDVEMSIRPAEGGRAAGYPRGGGYGGRGYDHRRGYRW